MNPQIPQHINVNIDVPIEFRAKDEYMLFLVNATYNVVHIMTMTNQIDGTTDYIWYNTFPITEMNGGLAYYENGWKIMPDTVQEAYAQYVVEKEVLND